MSNQLTHYYVAYHASMNNGGQQLSWRIVETSLDLDKSADLVKWIESEEQKRGASIVPVFWKKMDA
jgi:hypothetical protein